MKQLNDDSIDDDPLYDKVPSDEDYASVASEPPTSAAQQSLLFKNTPIFKTPILNINTPSSSNPVSTINSPNNLNPELLQISNSKSQLNPKVISKEIKIVEFKTNFEKINSLNTTPVLSNSSGLKFVNNNQEISKNKAIDVDRKALAELQNENELMKSMINSLMEENAQLRADKMLISMNNNGLYNEDNTGLYSTVNKKPSSSKIVLATNNSPLKSFNLNFSKINNDEGELQLVKMEMNKNNNNADMNESDYENQNTASSNNNNNQFVNYMTISREKSNEEKQYSNSSNSNNSNTRLILNESGYETNLYHKIMKKDTSPTSSLPNSPNSYSPINFKSETKQINHADASQLMPSKETVIRKMKKITKIIQELYKAIKESRFEM